MKNELFQQWADSIQPTDLETRSSSTNPKYFTTGAIKPVLADVDIDGVLYRRTPSVSVTFLPVKDAAVKELRTFKRQLNGLSPEEKASRVEQAKKELDAFLS